MLRCLGSLLLPLTTQLPPISHLLLPASHLPSPVSCLLSRVSHLSSTVSSLPFSSSPSSFTPLSLKHPLPEEEVKLTVNRRGAKLLLGGEGWVWLPAGVEDDCWVERGEFDCQQRWRMTAEWRGVSLTACRGVEWRLGGERDFEQHQGWGRLQEGEGWVWKTVGGENDHWAESDESPAGQVEGDRCMERGEFDHQKGWRKTAGWRGVSLITSRSWEWPLGRKGWFWPLAERMEDET